MPSSLLTLKVSKVLQDLYADSAAHDPALHEALRSSLSAPQSPLERFTTLKDVYMPVSREFGRLLYALGRTGRAKTIVEFGTSFGLSTIFLAAALKDNGGGKLITCEFIPEKAERARQNLSAAGLADLVEFRVGDALETLKDPGAEIDLIFLDGAKNLYLSVLKLLEPRLREGGVVAADNTDHEGLEDFLAHVRDPAKGYVTSSLLTGSDRHQGHEVSVRGGS
ncbi:MAG: methyltransferase domain-containing protein [Proteobacteria bacterium]|nr:MAG: methyltransferase domain-containing protein [Pseudomonadota bacterium]